MRPHPSPGAPVASTAPAEAKPAFAQALRGGVVATVVLLVVLMAIGVAHMFLAPDRKGLTDFFFFEQDLVVVCHRDCRIDNRRHVHECGLDAS